MLIVHVFVHVKADSVDDFKTATLLNAGAAIYVAGRADTLEAGVRAAEEALDSGAATEALDRLVALSQQLAPS